MGKLVPNKDFIRGPNSMVFLRDVTYDEWEKEGAFMLELAKAANGPLRFWWGDWLVYGEDKFGEKYSQAVDASGYEISTLRNAKWVCSKIAPSKRRDTLSFGHHQVVAAMPENEMDKWLSKADLESWSISELRKAIAADKSIDVGNGVELMIEDSFNRFMAEYKGSENFEVVKVHIMDDLRAIYEYAKTSG